MRFQRQWAMSHPAGPRHAFAQSTSPCSTTPATTARCRGGSRGAPAGGERREVALPPFDRRLPQVRAGGRRRAGGSTPGRTSGSTSWPGGPAADGVDPGRHLRPGGRGRAPPTARPGRKLMSSAGTPSPTVRPVTSAATTSGTGSPWSCAKTSASTSRARRYPARPRGSPATRSGAAPRGGRPRAGARAPRSTRPPGGGAPARPVRPWPHGPTPEPGPGTVVRRSSAGRLDRARWFGWRSAGARGHPASATCLGR